MADNNNPDKNTPLTKETMKEILEEVMLGELPTALGREIGGEEKGGGSSQQNASETRFEAKTKQLVNTIDLSINALSEFGSEDILRKDLHRQFWEGLQQPMNKFRASIIETTAGIIDMQHAIRNVKASFAEGASLYKAGLADTWQLLYAPFTNFGLDISKTANQLKEMAASGSMGFAALGKDTMEIATIFKKQRIAMGQFGMSGFAGRASQEDVNALFIDLTEQLGRQGVQANISSSAFREQALAQYKVFEEISRNTGLTVDAVRQLAAKPFADVDQAVAMGQYTTEQGDQIKKIIAPIWANLDDNGKRLLSAEISNRNFGGALVEMQKSGDSAGLVAGGDVPFRNLLTRVLNGNADATNRFNSELRGVSENFKQAKMPIEYDKSYMASGINAYLQRADGYDKNKNAMSGVFEKIYGNFTAFMSDWMGWVKPLTTAVSAIIGGGVMAAHTLAMIMHTKALWLGGSLLKESASLIKNVFTFGSKLGGASAAAGAANAAGSGAGAAAATGSIGRLFGTLGKLAGRVAIVAAMGYQVYETWQHGGEWFDDLSKTHSKLGSFMGAAAKGLLIAIIGVVGVLVGGIPGVIVGVIGAALFALDQMTGGVVSTWIGEFYASYYDAIASFFSWIPKTLSSIGSWIVDAVRTNLSTFGLGGMLGGLDKGSSSKVSSNKTPVPHKFRTDVPKIEMNTSDQKVTGENHTKKLAKINGEQLDVLERINSTMERVAGNTAYKPQKGMMENFMGL